jgi:Leucine-rich repeat (LRR) protein
MAGGKVPRTGRLKLLSYLHSKADKNCEGDLSLWEETGIVFLGERGLEDLSFASDLFACLPCLSELDLSFNQISTLGTFDPATFPASLLRLFLCGNQIDDAFTSCMSDFSHLHLLEELDLGSNAIVGVSHLRFPCALRILNLSENAIVDVSSLVLPESLESLNLRRNNITEVSRLVLPHQLSQLQLASNIVSDAATLMVLPEGCSTDPPDSWNRENSSIPRFYTAM